MLYFGLEFITRPLRTVACIGHSCCLIYASLKVTGLIVTSSRLSHLNFFFLRTKTNAIDPRSKNARGAGSDTFVEETPVKDILVVPNALSFTVFDSALVRNVVSPIMLGVTLVAQSRYPN